MNFSIEAKEFTCDRRSMFSIATFVGRTWIDVRRNWLTDPCLPSECFRLSWMTYLSNMVIFLHTTVNCQRVTKKHHQNLDWQSPSVNRVNPFLGDEVSSEIHLGKSRQVNVMDDVFLGVICFVGPLFCAGWIWKCNPGELVLDSLFS